MPITGVNDCVDKVYARGSFTVTILPAKAASASAEKAAGEPLAEEPPAASGEPAASEETAGGDQAGDDNTTAGEEPSASENPAANEGPETSEEPPEADAQAAAGQAAAADAVPAAAGTVVSVTGVDFNMRSLNGSDGSSTWKAFQSTSLGILVVDKVTGADGTLLGFNLSQRRYGHGCGLSQRGAEQRAKSSDPNVNTYDKILAFYYPETTLTTLDTSVPPLPAALPSTDYTNGRVVNVTTSVNVRSGPSSTEYAVIGTLPAGARLELMEAYVASDWFMINYGGKAAYIHRNYLEVDPNGFLSTMFIRRRGEIYVTPKTTCSTLSGSLRFYNGTVTIRNASGAVISGSALVGEGSTVTLTDSSGNVLVRLTVRVTRGDVDGDGRVTIADYTLVRLHILHETALDSYGFQMADINEDGEIDIADYTLLRLYLLGLWNFS